MEFTGERFLPEVSGDISLEHTHRYLLAALYARDKDVLDIASGEGYGSALLANTARSVVGVDISPEAVIHAQRRYAAHNLRFVPGSADAIPLADASVDMVVSFETIEHHNRHEEMFQEIKRVLRPGGLLCMSSPDRFEYSEVPGYHNAYHVKELNLEEFESLLSAHFAQHALLGQRVAYGSLIGPKEGAGGLLVWGEGKGLQTPARGMPRAVYLVALASDGELPSACSSLLELNAEDENYALPWRRKDAAELQALRLQVVEQAESLGRKLTEQAETLRSLELGLHERSARATALECEIRAMLGSRSWRITKPLRKAAAWVRAVRTGSQPAGGLPPEAAPVSVPTTPRNSMIQARVAAYKAGVTLSATAQEVCAVRDVRIHVADAGNHFFREIAELIRCGFADIGIAASVVTVGRFEDCAAPVHAQADLHLVIAPHELFHFVPQAQLWPHATGRLWLLNTEQEHTSWFSSAQATFGMADIVLDMDQDLAGRLNARGLRADHLPLGFSPSCRLFDGVAPVEINQVTLGLPLRIRDWMDQDDPLVTPLHERPLDCCFFGASTERRTAFFARHAALFADLESFLRLKPVIGPLRVGTTTPMTTECTSSIIRRSKIALNIHQSAHNYFEWHRIILQGIWQGAAVLSEPCTPAWPFRPDIDYITADLEHLADTLEYLLRSEDGRALAERTRQHARATLTTNCRMGDRLRELLVLHADIREKKR